MLDYTSQNNGENTIIFIYENTYNIILIQRL